MLNSDQVCTYLIMTAGVLQLIRGNRVQTTVALRTLSRMPMITSERNPSLGNTRDIISPMCPRREHTRHLIRIRQCVPLSRHWVGKTEKGASEFQMPVSPFALTDHQTPIQGIHPCSQDTRSAVSNSDLQGYPAGYQQQHPSERFSQPHCRDIHSVRSDMC